jgi:hypothetical protein
MAPSVGHCDTRISAGRRNEPLGAAANVFLASQANPTDFE